MSKRTNGRGNGYRRRKSEQAPAVHEKQAHAQDQAAANATQRPNPYKRLLAKLDTDRAATTLSQNQQRDQDGR
jgi:hypothetical protein